VPTQQLTRLLQVQLLNGIATPLPSRIWKVFTLFDRTIDPALLIHESVRIELIER
jgi:hypothetical protein